MRGYRKRGPIVHSRAKVEQFPTMMSLRRLCKHLEVSRATVTGWIRDKELPAVPAGEGWLILRHELIEWMEKTKRLSK